MDTPQANLEIARSTLRAEGGSISALADQLGSDFAAAAKMIYECAGKVILTGIGKAGLIGLKVSATLASTGTGSFFLNPVDAMHGDLGRVQRGDVLLALSHSGETEEIIRLVDHVKGRGASLIAVTGGRDTPLARYADIVVCYGMVKEACPLGLAPTVSTSIMLALGDALALTVMDMRRFRPEDFAVFHPGGALGRKLMTVEQAMFFKRGEGLCVASDAVSLGEALAQAEATPRRSGAMLLVDGAGKLSGILTDADLRRLLLAHRSERVLDEPVAKFLTKNPKCIGLGGLASEALAIMNKYRFDELPVVDGEGRPVGVIDVQDLVGIKTVTDGRD
ncbi:MAG: KpsF/GutQ family sugar-phosphate isomerase [Phycisphaerae bacterium]